MQRLAARRTACAASMVWATWCLFGAAPAPAQSLWAEQPPQVEPSWPSDPDAQPESAGSDQAAASESWQLLCRSVEQRAVEYRQFGDGEQQILVVGPLDGDEPAGVELLQRLVEHLDRFPRRLTGVTVTVVRDPNPDGRLRGARTNARGVRLDMNFPTRQWRKVPLADRWLSGRTPESEPETRALIELLDDLKPRRVVILEATRREAELRYSRAAEAVARQMATESDVTPIAWDAAAAPASFATYTCNDRNLPTVVFRVPAAADVEYNWTNFKRALLAALDIESNEQEQPRHQLTAFSRGAVSEHAETAIRPPEPRGAVLSAKDLELGGKLAPVNLPLRRADPAAVSPAASPPPRPPATPAKSDAARRWMEPFRGPVQRRAMPSVASGMLGKPVPYGALNRLQSPLPPPARRDRSATAAKVERLPPVDPKQSPPQPLPRPIPLYPATGY